MHSLGFNKKSYSNIVGLRVLVISAMYPNNFDISSGTFVHNNTRHLLKAGCKVKVISPVPFSPKILWFKPKWKGYGNIPKMDIIDTVPVYYPRYINLPGKWLHVFAYYTMYWGAKKTIHSIIDEFEPHIIHAHSATSSSHIGLKLKKIYNIPLICSLMGSDINIYPYYGRLSMWLTKKVITEADQLVSVSKALKIAANIIAKPKRKIRVVYNRCDLQIFNYNEISRRQYRNMLGISLKARVIIFVGHLLQSKGVYELINAFVKLNLRYSDLHLIFVGNGLEYSSINNIVSSNGLNKKVHLVGNQPQCEVPHWLSTADIFVLPTYYEGLPNVILEAMACSLPVIATRVGGIPEVIKEGKNGIFINEKSVESLTNAIEHLLKDEDLAKKMGSYARKVVEHKFSSHQQNAEEIIEICKEVINAKR